SFTLTVENNRKDLGSAARPVTKTLSSSFIGVATNGGWQYFRLELTSNTFWEVTVSGATQTAPDVYVQQGQLPTTSASLQSSVNITNDLIAFTSNQGAPGVYYIGVFGANAPAGGARYTLRIEPLALQELAWDPGDADLGTRVFSCTN